MTNNNAQGSGREVTRNKWIVLILIVLTSFMGSLSNHIVNVALPTMAEGLRVSTGMIAWVVTAFSVVTIASTLLFGRLGDIIGNIKVLRWGMILFTAASLLCGLSRNFTMLIAARMLQGVGSGAMFANSHGIITRIFPAEMRGRALGINSAFVALGNLAGPSLGGLILSGTSWPMLFFINVPIGAAAAVAQYYFLPKQWHEVGEKLDYKGAALFAFFVSGLFIALQQLQAWGLFHPVVLSGFAIALISFILFIVVQNTSKYPILDLSLFKNRWYSISLFCAFTSFLAISGFNFIFPFYLRKVLLFAPMATGLFMSIYPLVLIAVSPVSGYLTDRYGSELLTMIGLLLTASGFFCFATLSPDSPMTLPAIYVAVMAIGNGLFQAPNNTLVMSSLPMNKLGVGGSVNALVRNFGISFGVVLSSYILYSGISAKVGYHVTDFVTGREDAFMYGMKITYLVIGLVCVVGFLMTAMRMLRKKQRAK